MNNKIKAADAKFGEWYACDKYIRVRCVQEMTDEKLPAFIVPGSPQMVLRWFTDLLLTHLPDCTGWDWQPPKPRVDTSLDASCNRLEVWFNDEGVAEYEYGDVLTSDDAHRIIAAARKWDLQQQHGKRIGEKLGHTADEDCNTGTEPPESATDPDGVGEGWRLLRVGEEVRQFSDEINDWGKWKLTDCISANAVIVQDGDSYRRRIKPESLSPLYREVDEAHDAWVDELVRLCGNYDGHPNQYRHDIEKHLDMRGDKTN